MRYTSLLVALDGAPGCDGRVALAARLAAAHGSHLVGMAPARLGALSSTLGGAGGGLDAAEAARHWALRQATGWLDRFGALCRAHQVQSVEAEVHEGDPATAVLHRAKCVDLTIVGQAEPSATDVRQAERFVEQILLHSARPTLVVPATGAFEGVGRTVLVAWDDSHGAARAVADALPALALAAEVHLRSWRQPGHPLETLLHERLDALQAYLRRHGIASDAEVHVAATGTGEAILREAGELGADLIVMGTYGHSAWTERLLGGATRTVLQRSPLPLLMSR